MMEGITLCLLPFRKEEKGMSREDCVRKAVPSFHGEDPLLELRLLGIHSNEEMHCFTGRC